jgi:hypothetical protein
VYRTIRAQNHPRPFIWIKAVAAISAGCPSPKSYPR